MRPLTFAMAASLDRPATLWAALPLDRCMYCYSARLNKHTAIKTSSVPSEMPRITLATGPVVNTATEAGMAGLTISHNDQRQGHLEFVLNTLSYIRDLNF